MKKRFIIIGVFVLAAALIGAWLLARPPALGNMKHSYSEPETGSSDISFHGEAGDRIKFSFASEISGGALDIVLYDSGGNAVYELDGARKLETFYTLENSDTYTLAAEHSDFVGNYSITVYKMD